MSDKPIKEPTSVEAAKEDKPTTTAEPEPAPTSTTTTTTTPTASEGSNDEGKAVDETTTTTTTATSPSKAGSEEKNPGKKAATKHDDHDDDEKPAEPLSAVDERATAPATPELLSDQLDMMLYSLRTLSHLLERCKYISQLEVTNMRRAYDFTVSEFSRHVGDGRPRRAGVVAKVAEAEGIIKELEDYVASSPLGKSYEYTNTSFSWRSVLHTPSERRMQSVMASVFLFFTFIPVATALMVVLFSWRYTAPFAIAYVIYIFTIGKVQHPIKRNLFVAQHQVWKYYRDFFPVRLIVPDNVRQRLDRSRNYLFCYHPHGVHGFGAIINFGLDTNDFLQTTGINTHIQTLAVNFYIPFWRRLMIWMGCGDASSACIRKTLRGGPGESVALIVGGAEESLMSKPNTNDLYLMKRRGFLKIALQEGSPLVPVYGFGENNCYKKPEIADNRTVKKVLRVVKKFTGFVPLLIAGRGFFNYNWGLMPHRTPIVVVVGEPLEMPRIAEPTVEEMDYWQQRYVEALEKLYVEHRGIYDLQSTGLRIMN